MKAGVIIGSVLLLCAVGGAGFAFGMAHESKLSAKAIGDARSQQQTAHDDAKAARDALADVQQRLDKQKADLDRARQIAATALDQRDAALSDLSKLTHQRGEALRTAARESHDCADLAHMPICPAVAERLFSTASGPPSGSR